MKKLYICLLIAFIGSSCKGYLDIKPYGRTIPKTAEEFSALMHKHLDELDNGSSNYFVGNAQSLLQWDVECGDDFETCLTEPGGNTLAIYAGSLLNLSSASAGYTQLYAVIRDCNIVLGEMKEDGTTLSNKVRATAYALRAVCYYQLLRTYCEVPETGKFEEQLGVPLVKSFDMEERPIRSSMQATIDLIESDLKASINYECTDDLYRFTEDVCKGYLARLYFWTKQWDKALTISQEILKSHPLVDADAYKTMMQSTFKISGNQIIKAYRSYTSSTSTEYTAAVNIIKYRPVSKRFINQFSTEERTTDVRYSLDINRKRQAIKPFFCGMRSAEFKLMEAECYYHLSKPDEALASINDLRSLRISNYKKITMNTLPSLSPDEIIKVDVEGKALTPLMGLILNERRKEMFLEGDRFFELKRNGSPEFWVAYNGRRYTTLKFMYTFPLPATDIEIVPGLIQNSGYTELVTN